MMHGQGGSPPPVELKLLTWAPPCTAVGSDLRAAADPGSYRHRDASRNVGISRSAWQVTEADQRGLNIIISKSRSSVSQNFLGVTGEVHFCHGTPPPPSPLVLSLSLSPSSLVPSS